MIKIFKYKYKKNHFPYLILQRCQLLYIMFQKYTDFLTQLLFFFKSHTLLSHIKKIHMGSMMSHEGKNVKNEFLIFNMTEFCLFHKVWGLNQHWVLLRAWRAKCRPQTEPDAGVCGSIQLVVENCASWEEHRSAAAMVVLSEFTTTPQHNKKTRDRGVYSV